MVRLRLIGLDRLLNVLQSQFGKFRRHCVFDVIADHGDWRANPAFHVDAIAGKAGAIGAELKDHVGGCLEQGLAFGFGAFAVGNIPQHDQATGELTAPIMQGRNPQVEITRRWRADSDFGLGLFGVAITLDEVRLISQNRFEVSSNHRRGRADQLLGGWVDVNDSILRINHNDAVYHALDQRIARERNQIEQLKTENTDGVNDPTDRKGERRQIQSFDWTEVRHIDHVSDPRQRRADQQCPELIAITLGETKNVAEQLKRANEQQAITVRKMNPKPRAMTVDQVVAGIFTWDNAIPDQAVPFVSQRQ